MKGLCVCESNNRQRYGKKLKLISKLYVFIKINFTDVKIKFFKIIKIFLKIIDLGKFNLNKKLRESKYLQNEGFKCL